MRSHQPRTITLLLICAGLAGCGATAEPKSGTSESSTSRPQSTAQECEASGGVVVGDIGDGATHRPEYRCPSGAAPSGNIRAPEGGPFGIEGAVCCPQ